jgi:hypothetical protein
MSKYDAFFVSDAVHERTVTLADGTEHKLYFKEVPATAYRKFQFAEQSEDEDVRAGSLALLIAASLCEADGSPALTYERACALKAGVSSALIDKVLEVNGKKPGNALPPGEKTASGMSSPLPSAAAQ